MIIRKRGDKYYYHFSYYDDEGKRHQVERAGTASKKETRELGRQAEAKCRASFHVPSAIPCEKLFNEWISFIKSDESLKANTIKKYDSIVKNYLIPAFGKHQIRKISPKTLQNYLNSLECSRSNINIICSVLRKSFTYAAVMAEYIETSPAESIHCPKRLEPPKETVVFSENQINQIFAHLKNTAMLTPASIAYYTGMRAGEVLALKWDDIDFKNKLIHIHSTITGDSIPVLQDIPKTNSSIRTIPFGAKLYTYLSEWHIAQQKYKLFFGPEYTESDFICTECKGKQLTLNNIRALNKWIKTHIGPGSFHSFRHTYATLLLEHGADLELVSKQLGHSSIALTAKVYSHVLDRRRNKLTSVIDEAL